MANVLPPAPLARLAPMLYWLSPDRYLNTSEKAMPPDSIHLEGMVFYAYHGSRPEERELGQRFVVDLDVQADLRQAGASDRLEDTVDYSRLYRLVKEVIEGPPRNLLEAVAEEVTRRVLEGFPLVEEVRVRIAKPGVAIKGSVLKEVAAVVERRRG